MSEIVEEMANGGGLASLGRLLSFEDREFWKGALIGAAAVLLLTNESVQKMLFRGTVRAKDTFQEGFDKFRQATHADQDKAEEKESGAE